MMTLRPFLLSMLIVVMALAATACNGCSSLEEPDGDPEARIADLAQHVPEDADAALVVPEIRQMPDAMESILQRHRHVEPGAEALATRISRDLGVQITSLEMMELAGFHPDGSLMVSMVDGRPVLTAHIADKNAFNRYVTGHVRREHRTETRIDEATYGEREFIISGDSALDDMAWYFDGAAVVLVMPPYDFFSAHVSNRAVAVATDLGEMAPDATLADSDEFQQFRTRVGDDYPVSLHLPDVGVLDEETTETIGLGFRAEPARIEVDGFVDDDSELAGLDWSDLLAADGLTSVLAMFGLTGDELEALGPHLDVDADDDALNLDFSTAHDAVSGVEALEDHISMVRAIDEMAVTTDADDNRFHVTIEFTEPLAAQ